jgi:hypothetical protein
MNAPPALTSGRVVEQLPYCNVSFHILWLSYNQLKWFELTEAVDERTNKSLVINDCSDFNSYAIIE